MASKHPKGLYVLFFTEMWERFGFYLMLALFTFYLKNHLKLDQVSAANHYAWYMALVYLTPFPGGLLADRSFGYTRSVLSGSLLLSAGYFALAIDSPIAMYGALGLLVLGNGLFKPNISTLVGNLYPQGDSRRDSAFSIFYMGINIGAGIAPFVAGAMRKHFGYSAAFAAAGVGMLLSFCTFAIFRKHLEIADRRSSVSAVLDVPLPQEYEDPRDPPAVERQRIIALVIMCGIVMLFWMAFHQNGSTLSLWALDNTVRKINFFGTPVEIEAEYFAAVNSVFIITLTPVLVWVFGRLRQHGLEPSTPGKIGIGMLLTGTSYAIMVGASLSGGDHGAVSMWWLIACYFVITIAELCLSPMGLSMVTKLAPRRMTAMLMGCWFISTSIGNYLAGKLGTMWDAWPHSRFFGLLVVSSIFAALVLATQLKRLRAAMPPEGPADGDAAPPSSVSPVPAPTVANVSLGSSAS